MGFDSQLSIVGVRFRGRWVWTLKECLSSRTYDGPWYRADLENNDQIMNHVPKMMRLWIQNSQLCPVDWFWGDNSTCLWAKDRFEGKCFNMESIPQKLIIWLIDTNKITIRKLSLYMSSFSNNYLSLKKLDYYLFNFVGNIEILINQNE